MSDSLPDRGDYPDTYIRHILRFSVPVVSLFAAHAENHRTFLLFKRFCQPSCSPFPECLAFQSLHAESQCNDGFQTVEVHTAIFPVIGEMFHPHIPVFIKVSGFARISVLRLPTVQTRHTPVRCRILAAIPRPCRPFLSLRSPYQVHCVIFHFKIAKFHHNSYFYTLLYIEFQHGGHNMASSFPARTSISFLIFSLVMRRLGKQRLSALQR